MTVLYCDVCGLQVTALLEIHCGSWNTNEGTASLGTKQVCQTCESAWETANTAWLTAAATAAAQVANATPMAGSLAANVLAAAQPVGPTPVPANPVHAI